MSQNSAVAEAPTGDPIVAAFQHHKQAVAEVEPLMQQRERIVVNISKEQVQLAQIDEQISVRLGLASPVKTPEAPKGNAEPQSALQNWMKQAIMDKGPLTPADTAKHILEAGYKTKSTPEGFVAVVAQEFKRLKNKEFRIFGRKQKRGNRWAMVGEQPARKAK